MLERAALELTPFLDEVAFVGGATVAFWLTDPAGPKPRVTKDVDVVVEVATRVAWYGFEERLRGHGLRNDTSSPVVCRWRAGGPGDELVIDLMPGDAAILGFENRWQKPALDHARDISLPIRAAHTRDPAALPARDQAGGMEWTWGRRSSAQPRP